ncbi:MAG: hypothetical protein IJ083_15870 [Clostridia bacterium]|nr:hypothetical protein [Clostridia bacterium]
MNHDGNCYLVRGLRSPPDEPMSEKDLPCMAGKSTLLPFSGHIVTDGLLEVSKYDHHAGSSEMFELIKHTVGVILKSGKVYSTL